jgi:hypothetical protein
MRYRSRLADALARNGSTLLLLKEWPNAEPVFRECLAIRSKMAPNAWTTYNTMSMLGEALLRQKKYADAEPLLRAGFEGMKKHESDIPPAAKTRLTEGLSRLVWLYEATNQKETVEKLKKELQARKDAEQKTKP